jgi:hypothetical protein
MQTVCRDFPENKRRFIRRNGADGQFRCAGCLKSPQDSAKISAGSKAGRGRFGEEYSRPRQGRGFRAEQDKQPEAGLIIE